LLFIMLDIHLNFNYTDSNISQVLNPECKQSLIYIMNKFLEIMMYID